ncbi:hypothetical protein GW17_00024702 [Ensete ventricosum]|nr:hypothetical protein GW17_00024702 [Ensete ventricosum]
MPLLLLSSSSPLLLFAAVAVVASLCHCCFSLPLSLLFAVVAALAFGQQSRPAESQTKASRMPPPKEDEDSGADEEEDVEEHENTLCGACGDNYANDEFWICCDVCERWFHGKCVKITPARAEHIKQYKCPSCSNKRAKA